MDSCFPHHDVDQDLKRRETAVVTFASIIRFYISYAQKKAMETRAARLALLEAWLLQCCLVCRADEAEG